MWRCQQRGNNIRDDDGKKRGIPALGMAAYSRDGVYRERKGERREGSHSAADRFLIIGALV